MTTPLEDLVMDLPIPHPNPADLPDFSDEPTESSIIPLVDVISEAPPEIYLDRALDTQMQTVYQRLDSLASPELSEPLAHAIRASREGDCLKTQKNLSLVYGALEVNPTFKGIISDSLLYAIYDKAVEVCEFKKYEGFFSQAKHFISEHKFAEAYDVLQQIESESFKERVDRLYLDGYERLSSLLTDSQTTLPAQTLSHYAEIAAQYATYLSSQGNLSSDIPKRLIENALALSRDLPKIL